MIPFTYKWSTRIFLLVLVSLTVSLYPASAALNGTETIITTDTAGSFQLNPAIDNNLIAWDDQRLGIGMNNIYAYNLQTGSEYPVLPDVANPYLWQTTPSVHDDWIIWQQDDGTNYNIIAYNNETLETIIIPATPKGLASYSYFADPADNVLPKTNGTAVVWQDYSNEPYWGIYLYDLTLGSGGSADPIIADPGYDQKNPAISGDYLVYENWSSGQSDIYLYYGINKTAVRISQFSNNDLNPSIDGTRIVWQRNNVTTGFNAVYLYDLDTGQVRQITPAGSLFNQVNAKISGSRVVVQDDRVAGATQIYTYNLNTNPPTEKWVTTPVSRYGKSNPAVSGDRIVWEDYRNGIGDDSDIYLNTLGLPETCPLAGFAATPSSVHQGDTVTFSADPAQAGASAISHLLWNFSDGSPWVVSTAMTATHLYSEDGVFPVKVTVGNPKCRNVSTNICRHSVFVNSPPAADFTATPEYGLSPLTVHFTDTSCGEPLNWSWDFDDGSFSHIPDPIHRFTLPGREYTVTLTVNNTRADYATTTRSKMVKTFMGAQNTASIPLAGITVDNRFGGSFLTYDSLVLPAHFPPPPATYLVVYPPEESGWDNLTFIASDTTGVRPTSPNRTYFANISRIYLKTKDTIAITSGTPPVIGNNWGTSYQINTTTYPAEASIKTEIWEGSVPADRARFDYIATHATTPELVRNIAYTARITRHHFVNQGTAKINMSVANSWVLTTSHVYILGFGYDSDGNLKGAILPVKNHFSSGDLDYYEAEIPGNANFLSTFGLADIEGSGNPFQLITLTVASHISPPLDDQPAVPVAIANVPVTVQTTNLPRTTAPADPGRTEKIYSNAQGVITQETRLRSTDSRAQLLLGNGVIAKDRTGAPLSSVTVTAVPAESLPPSPSSAGFVFAGMAYRFEPEGATFYPEVPLTFTYPQAGGQEKYSLKSFDSQSGTWQDLPTTRDPNTALITAPLSHFSYVALFSQPIISATPSPEAATPVQTPSPPLTQAPPPATALTIFTGMMIWVTDLVIKNSYVVVILVLLGIAYVVRKRIFPGSGW